jgi:hypothetical protein
VICLRLADVGEVAIRISCDALAVTEGRPRDYPAARRLVRFYNLGIALGLFVVVAGAVTFAAPGLLTSTRVATGSVVILLGGRNSVTFYRLRRHIEVIIARRRAASDVD